MKNILLSVIFVAVFLPQLSFAAPEAAVPAGTVVNPLQDQCNTKIGAQFGGFWDKQAAERDAFGKEHPDSLAAHDKYFKATLDISMAQRKGLSTTGLPTPPPDDATFLAFQAKQQSDKAAYLSEVNQAMQKCLSGS